MSDKVGNPEDRFSRDAAQMLTEGYFWVSSLYKNSAAVDIVPALGKIIT